jgi:hypothetical protein
VLSIPCIPRLFPSVKPASILAYLKGKLESDS